MREFSPSASIVFVFWHGKPNHFGGFFYLVRRGYTGSTDNSKTQCGGGYKTPTGVEEYENGGNCGSGTPAAKDLAVKAVAARVPLPQTQVPLPQPPMPLLQAQLH